MQTDRQYWFDAQVMSREQIDALYDRAIRTPGDKGEGRENTDKELREYAAVAECHIYEVCLSTQEIVTVYAPNGPEYPPFRVVKVKK